MTDNTDSLLTEQDIADLESMHAEPSAPDPSYHTLLEVWQQVLAPAAEEATKQVTPTWAARMCGEYKQLQIQEMNTFRDIYFGGIAELGAVLDAEIETDVDALKIDNQAEDALENRHHYLNVLRDWQLTLLQWELDWDCTDADAHIRLAAISEVHKMFFGPTGLTAFLDNIGFEFDEADQEMLGEALEELRGEQ